MRSEEDGLNEARRCSSEDYLSVVSSFESGVGFFFWIGDLRVKDPETHLFLSVTGGFIES